MLNSIRHLRSSPLRWSYKVARTTGQGMELANLYITVSKQKRFGKLGLFIVGGVVTTYVVLPV